MKKLFSLLVIVLLVAGCNKEKTYQKDLTGTWQVYKYILYNADVTQQFMAQYGSCTISFNGSGKFIRTYSNPDTTFVAGTYHFASNDQQLILVDSVYTLVDTVFVASINQEQYTLFDLTSSGVQLRTDSSDLYMDKLK